MDRVADLGAIRRACCERRTRIALGVDGLLAFVDRIAGAKRGQVKSLVRVLSTRAIRVRYRGSLLGILWSVSNPIIMTAVYAFVFGRTFSSYYGGSKLHYMAALFSGLAVMNYFSTSTFQALQSVVSNGMLLNKMRVPSIVFPISTVIANSFQLFVGTLPALLIIAVVIGGNPFWMAVIVFPLVALVCLTLGVGLALSALYVFFRDVPYLYELTYFAIFVATPIFYPLEIIDPKYRGIVEYNPLSLIVEQIREIVVRGGSPSPLKLAIASVAGVLTLGMGALLFNRASRAFMDYL